MAVQWQDPTPDIGTILRRTRDLRLTRMINIFIGDDGAIQVSVQRKNSNAYNVVSGSANQDPLMALVEALGPGHGKSWAKHLQLQVREPGSTDEDEDEDDFSDLI